jgi:hypothetical protein
LRGAGARRTTPIKRREKALEGGVLIREGLREERTEELGKAVDQRVCWKKMSTATHLLRAAALLESGVTVLKRKP